MAFKLLKSELARRDEILADLRSSLDKLTAAIEDPASTTGQKSEAAAMFTVILNEAEEFREDIACKYRDLFDERSDNWQDSDRGQEVDEAINEWECAIFDDCDLDILEPTTDGLGDYIEQFENLPIEV